MNFCECGCGEMCNNRFVQGHNFRKPKDAYVDSEYENLKKWLSDFCDKYYVTCRFAEHDAQMPIEIIITAHREGNYMIGRGSSFMEASGSIIEQMGIPILA